MSFFNKTKSEVNNTSLGCALSEEIVEGASMKIVDNMISEYQKLVEHYRNRAVFFLVSLVISYILLVWAVVYKIDMHFSVKEITKVIAVTENISFNSIIFQSVHFIAFLIISLSITTILHRIFKRSDDLASYYSSRISSLKFLKVFFIRELQDSFGNCEEITEGSFREKIVIGLAKTHRPGYLFDHVLYRQKLQKDNDSLISHLKNILEPLLEFISDKYGKKTESSSSKSNEADS